MAKEETRNYKGTDSNMLEQSQTLQALFVTDKTDFIATNPDFNDPYATNWADANTAALTFTPDSVPESAIETETDDISEGMKACIKKYKQVKYYLDEAFPGQRDKQTEFGVGAKYRAACRSKEKMIIFMNGLSVAANKYKTDLIAKGYTQPKIDEILTLANALLTDTIQQDTAQKERPAVTAARVKLLNAAFAFMNKVSKAAPQVYPDDFTHQQQYVFHENISHTEVYCKLINAVTNANIEGGLCKMNKQLIQWLTGADGVGKGFKMKPEEDTITFSMTGFVSQTKDCRPIQGKTIYYEIHLVPA